MHTSKTQLAAFNRRDRLARVFPILHWARHYNRETFGNDVIAAIIVTIMLIPQSLAYALLAGLPPEAGIYASILPIVLYAIFGTSRTLAVGPVAVISLMTAAAIGEIAQSGTAGYAAAALLLAFLSGAILLIMGIFRLGFIANFLSHPVIAGFITASGILIALSQLKHIFGINAQGQNLPALLGSLGSHVNAANPFTLTLGILAIAFLIWIRAGLKPVLIKNGLEKNLSNLVVKAGPIAAVILTTLAAGLGGLANVGVEVVGAVPQSLPPFTMPPISVDLIDKLFIPALLISLVGFVESISVAQTLAAKKRQRIDPNQELIGLGIANLGASFSGGYPVTGGIARSVVNFDAGAATPAAGAFTAFGLAFAALTITPLIYFLPKAALAATIIVAVLSAVDFSILTRSWSYSKADFAAVATTIFLTLFVGVEFGVMAGVVLSIALHIYRTSRPHIAEVGLLPGCEHFRNINRHKVRTDPEILTIRVDESLYFANARFLEDYIYNRVAQDCDIKHVILMCSAVNEIDFSALESLEAIMERLSDLKIKLHLSEVKGPVMDQLEKTHFLHSLTGEVYLSQFDAFKTLSFPLKTEPANLKNTTKNWGIH